LAAARARAYGRKQGEVHGILAGRRVFLSS